MYQRTQPIGLPNAQDAHHPGESPVCRAFLRPELQVLSVQPISLVIRTPVLPVPVKRAVRRAVKKVLVASTNVQMPPNVQMLKPVPSQVSPASKGFVQKGPLLKAHPLLSDSETVRSKFRENLGGALCVDSDQQIVQKSAGNISPFRSACEDKYADGGTLHEPSTSITLNEGEADTATGPKSVGSISEQHDTLTGGILGSDMAIKVSKDAQEQSIHVCLENDVSGNNTVTSDDFLQCHGPVCAPDIVVGTSESISLLNSKRSTPSDTEDGTTVPLNEPEFKRAKISLWEGTIHFKLSSFITVVAIFKSGEMPSTNDWCRFVEIKGRVKLTDFQDFLEQLRNSTSRAVTVTELRWKEGSHESGRQQFMQRIESYIADERVGLLHLAEGVELYICPSQGKTAQVLAEHLPKEDLGILTVTSGVQAIGVFVWPRPVQPMPISRKQQAVIATSVPMSSQPTRPASQFVHPNEHHCLENDATDDIPPGFGRHVVKDDNDLPAYDRVRISNRPNEAIPYSYPRQQSGQACSPPQTDLDRQLQLVRKYGRMDDSAEPSDRSHDDLPESDPSLSGHWYNAMRQQPVLPSPLPQVYTLPQEHARTVQWSWDDRAKVLSVQPGWRQSRPQWQDIPQRTRIVVELDLGVPQLTALRGAREPWLGSWMPH